MIRNKKKPGTKPGGEEVLAEIQHELFIAVFL